MERFSRQPTNPPTAAAPATTHQTASSGPAHAATKLFGAPTGASKVLVFVLTIAAISVILAFGLSAFGAFRNTSLIMDDRYQAVFLDNGQVYFGKLSGVNSEYVKLTDIFYLQVEQQIQPDQEQADGSSSNSDDQTQIRLAKLGNELHGPEDVMYVQRSKIVFWENLKNEGDVVKAITTFKNGGGNTQQNNTNNSSSGTSPAGSDAGNDTSTIEADTSN